MSKPRVLVVDDEESIRHVLNRVLEMNGCEVRQAGSAEEAVKQIADWEPAVAMVDIVLPGKNGIQFLADVKKIYKDTEVLVMTSNSSANTALQAIRSGAYDYLQKPFDNLKEIWTNVQRALEKRGLGLKNREVLEKAEARNQQLSNSVSLPEADDGLSDFSSLKEVMENFLAVVMAELDVKRASLMLLNSRSRELQIVASRGVPRGMLDMRVALGEGIAGRVAQTGEPFLVTDAATDLRVDERPDLSSSFISAPIAFSVPIKSEREIFGVVNVTNRASGKPFTADDTAFLSGLAGQLGIVIDGARRSDQLHKAYQSLRVMQDQLVFSERIKAVGQMAAGVAHDFNNSLSVILTRAQFAINRLEDGAPDLDSIRADLETIVKTSLQGAETIKRVQEYTRIRKGSPNASVDLNAVILDAVEIARPMWKEQCEAVGVSVEVITDLGPIEAVSGNVYELTQVVNNLIFNAVEAMPDGGTIRISTRVDEGRVRMQVTDSGTGMSDETRQRIFEPFFSTKETGQGLGTSIIFNIVERHQGRIDVESELGKGTSFTIRLPIFTGDLASEGPIAEPETLPPVESRILLVDDDATVRETNAEILGCGGHTVTAVASGSQALKRLQRERFDLVITDLSMPGMSGLELAEKIRSFDSELPVLLFSGWAIQEQEEKLAAVGIEHVLAKPCLMEDLLATVQRATRRTREVTP